MSENTEEMRSLALTPTWSVATVLTIFVAVSLLVERSIHRLSNVSGTGIFLVPFFLQFFIPSWYYISSCKEPEVGLLFLCIICFTYQSCASYDLYRNKIFQFSFVTRIFSLF